MVAKSFFCSKIFFSFVSMPCFDDSRMRMEKEKKEQEEGGRW